jgi:hypothetical protein
MTPEAWVALFHEGVNALEQHRFPEAADIFSDLVKDLGFRRRRNAWINRAAAELNRSTEATHGPRIAACERAQKNRRSPSGTVVPSRRFDEAPRPGRRSRTRLQGGRSKRAPEDPTALYFLATLIGDRNPEQAIALLDRALERRDAPRVRARRDCRGSSTPHGQRRRRSRPRGLQGRRSPLRADGFARPRTDHTELGRLGEAVRTPDVTVPRASADMAPGVFGARPSDDDLRRRAACGRRPPCVAKELRV